MDILENILSEEIIQRLGWTLVHFVWQATVVALILAIVLRLLRRYSVNLRYIIACIALAVIVLMPAATIRTIDVSLETAEPIKQDAVDLPKVGAHAQAVVEMPQVESPLVQVAAASRAALKDRFSSAVEPALPYVVVGWLVGVLGLSIWHLGGWTQLQRLRRRMVKQVSERVHLRLRHLSERLGVKRAIKIAESALVQVPTVVGWLKPVILLPGSALTGLSGEQLEAILAHELAHIKRHDYLVNMLQTVVEILGFYHPAVWWVSHKIRVERENCCDDLAVSVSGGRVRYARALTSLEEVRGGYSLAVAASGGSLFDRIRRLAGKESADSSRAGWLPSVISILLITSFLIPISFAMSSRSKTDIESAAKKLDYSSVTVEKGVGFDDIIVGDVNCTKEFVRSRLGKPDDDVKDTETNGWWLNYRKKYGLDFWFNKNNILKEIRLNKGFKGKLTTGISVSSSKEDVFERYGYPVSEKITDNLHRKNDDRVLYKKGQTSRIFYANNLLLFWFDGNRINQIVTYPRKTEPAVEVAKKTDTIKKLFMPDVEKEPVALDLASGELIEILYEGEIDASDDFSEALKELKEGDLIYHNGGFFCLRGATMAGKPHFESGFPFPWYGIAKYLPVATIVTTGEGKKYNLNVLEATGKGCLLMYSSTSIDGEVRPEILAAQFRDEKIQKRIESANKLSDLGKALLIYASDYDEKYPDTLEEIKSYLESEQDFQWISENVEYPGKGKSIAISPQEVVAYDKTLLEKGEGTNVLYNDLHVKFENTERLVKLGIIIESSLEVLDIDFEPIHQGKNVVRVKVRNTSEEEQMFRLQIYTRSPDYGRSGVGWGTSFFESIKAGETKQARFAFKIQGPITESTYVRLDFHNPGPAAGFDMEKWYQKKERKKWFKRIKYSANDLERQEKVAEDFRRRVYPETDKVVNAFRQIQDYIKTRKYEEAWELFTKDYQDAEFQIRGLERFKQAMEPSHPLHSAFMWEKSDFLNLKPTQHITRKDNVLTLHTRGEKRVWKIDFVREDGQWKIDWIGGYVPRIVQDWEDRVLPMMGKRSTKHFDIYCFKDSTAEKEIDQIVRQKEKGFREICRFLGKDSDVRICMVFFEDGKTKQMETGHQGNGWAYGNTIVEVYNKEQKLDPYHETVHILMGPYGSPPALFNEGFAVYMSERLGSDALDDLSGGKSSLYERVRELKSEGEWIEFEELITYTEIGSKRSRPPVSYAEAGAFAKFLIDEYGRDKFLQAYKTLKNSDDKAVHQQNIKALEAIYGRALRQLEKQWEDTFSAISKP